MKHCSNLTLFHTSRVLMPKGEGKCKALRVLGVAAVGVNWLIVRIVHVQTNCMQLLQTTVIVPAVYTLQHKV